MSRLYDRVLRSGNDCAIDDEVSRAWWRNGGWAPNAQHALEDATVVHIGNVANYWFAHKPGVKSLVNLAPPFPLAFYECKRPAFVPEAEGFAEWGFAVAARDFSDEEQREEWLEWERGGGTGIERPDIEHARWVVEYSLFADDPKSGGLAGPIGTWYTFLDNAGQEVAAAGQPKGSWYIPMLPAANTKERRDYFYGFGLALLGPVLFAVSLMHCKNVALEENEPAKKLSRKHRKRYGNALTRYYTLAIDPLGAAPSQRSDILGDRTLRSMHIARGHFATYSPEKPLFGKYSGTFWRPQHVRGSKAQGEIIKDYKVKAPRR